MLNDIIIEALTCKEFYLSVKKLINFGGHDKN